MIKIVLIIVHFCVFNSTKMCWQYRMHSSTDCVHKCQSGMKQPYTFVHGRTMVWVHGVPFSAPLRRPRSTSTPDWLRTWQHCEEVRLTLGLCLLLWDCKFFCYCLCLLTFYSAKGILVPWFKCINFLYVVKIGFCLGNCLSLSLFSSHAGQTLRISTTNLIGC